MYETCPNCDGYGIVPDYGAFGMDFEGDKECPDCKGSGQVILCSSDQTVAEDSRSS
jgi:DnaJ-class molecular chaperone